MRTLPQLIKSGAGRCAGGLVVLVTASSLPGGRGGADSSSGASLLLSQAGLVFSTVALGHLAHSGLEALASGTGGRSFALLTANELHSAKIDDALATVTSQLTPKQKRDITVGTDETFWENNI